MQRTEADFSTQLGVPITLAAADLPVSLGALTTGELAQWRAKGSDAAQRNWLLGRTALKSLAPHDTSGLQFPHPSVSLTHGGGWAVAVGTATPLSGIGVDFEPWRTQVHPRVASFFLRSGEQATAVTAKSLVRLWTIKEALFKALPGNEGCVFLDFELDDPVADFGMATGPRGEMLRYARADFGDGSLAVAITPKGGSCVPV